jgi:hypothetical protein
VRDIVSMRRGDMPSFTVVSIDPGRALVLRARDAATGAAVDMSANKPLAADATWTFILDEVGDHTARLMERSPSHVATAAGVTRTLARKPCDRNIQGLVHSASNRRPLAGHPESGAAEPGPSRLEVGRRRFRRQSAGFALVPCCGDRACTLRRYSTGKLILRAYSSRAWAGTRWATSRIPSPIRMKSKPIRAAIAATPNATTEVKSEACRNAALAAT